MSESPDNSNVSRYLPVLEYLANGNIEFVLAAGHAVNAWAQYFYDRIEGIETFLPFTSKDADLLATRDELYQIAKKLPGTLKTFQDLRSPVLGVFTTGDEPPLKIELLQGLYGMGNTEKIIKRAKHFGCIPVIDPVLLLVSKAANLGGLDQQGRQDEKHLKLMSRITQCYLEDLLKSIGKQISERDLIRELKLLIRLLKQSLPSRGLSMAKLQIIDCLPMDSFTDNIPPKIKRFLSQSLGIFW